MMSGVSLNSSSSSSSSFLCPLHQHGNCSKSQYSSSIFFANYSHQLQFQPLSLSFRSATSRYRRFQRHCSSFPGPPGTGESDSRAVLDAFFLGKALGEAMTARIESAVGEFLSTVGRLQAEQQKQIQEFQEDVLERAKRAKEKAAREAMQGQLIIPNSTTENASAVPNGSGSSSVSPSALVSVVDPDGVPSRVDQDQRENDSLSSIPIDE